MSISYAVFCVTKKSAEDLAGFRWAERNVISDPDFCSYAPRGPSELRSFPTRRSSDLAAAGSTVIDTSSSAERLPAVRVDDYGYIKVPFVGRLRAAGHKIGRAHV